jgi:predicted ferric reductase
MREAANATLDPVKLWKWTMPMPQVGKVFLVVSNIIVLTVLCFVGFPDTLARAQLENIAYRIGFVCLAQIPLLFLLSGKNNIIGFLTGMSYERLNWLHRWCARTLFLFATIHFGYWLTDWWPYGGYVGKQIRTNNLVYWGLTAWCFLAWIVLSSFAPVRRLSYEFFVIQHLVTFSCFIGFTYKHLQPFPSTHVYLWICVGLFFFDRLTRAALMLYTNISYFHPEQRRAGGMNSFWAGKAEFTPLQGGYTKISMKHPPISWQPGQHVFVSCHSVVPLQSHPFTISSLPQDGKIEFIVKSEKGGTRRFFRHAEKSTSLPNSGNPQLRTVALEGPYGRIRPLRQFDSVVLFAGSTGATFTTPLLRDIVLGWQARNAPGTLLSPGGVVTRRVRLIWVVKRREQLNWFAAQLNEVVDSAVKLRAAELGVDVEISIYCTCDESFTSEHKSLLSSLEESSLSREKSLGDSKSDGEDSSSQSSFVEKKGKSTIRESVHEIGRRHSNAHTCGGGTCACTSTIEDEGEEIKLASPCCCDAGNSDSSKSSPLSVSNKALLHPSIAVFAGRPNPRNLIRKSLEQALGESAVVVCGPAGLVSSVRSSVVKLSDERAVHKGTGAQGIYLHCESFNY